MESSSPRKRRSERRAVAPTYASAARRAITPVGSTRRTRGRSSSDERMTRALPPRSAPRTRKTSESCCHRSSSSLTAIRTTACRRSQSNISERPYAVVVLDLLGLYAVAGVVTAVAFVTFGVAQVLPAGTPVTVGARLLLLPGAAALWPYVLLRWVKAHGAR